MDNSIFTLGEEKLIYSIENITKNNALSCMVNNMGLGPTLERKVFETIIERENLMTTAMPGVGIATPHTVVAELGKIYVQYLYCQEGIYFQGKSNIERVYFIMMFASNKNDGSRIRCMARFAIFGNLLLKHHSLPLMGVTKIEVISLMNQLWDEVFSKKF